MVSRESLRSRTRTAALKIIILLLIGTTLFCGCLDVEPEELPPQAASSPAATTLPPTAPANITANTSIVPPPIVITSPKQAHFFTDQDFPPEVKEAISDFTEGRTTDTINGFLRWESVRAKTNPSDTSRIREQIHRIDYAVYNTTIQENISLYIGISGEHAKRVRNESVFSENGYAIASYDPSIVYQRFGNSGRDSEGYLTMCVIDFKKGNRLLFVNATEREYLLPRGGIWDIAGEETYEELVFSADSIPRNDDFVQTKVRLIHTREHP